MIATSGESHKEKILKNVSQILFWLGIICIPFAWIVWYMGPELEFVREVMSDIADPAVRAALQEAHAERLGTWIAIWPVTQKTMNDAARLAQLEKPGNAMRPEN